MERARRLADLTAVNLKQFEASWTVQADFKGQTAEEVLVSDAVVIKVPGDWSELTMGFELRNVALPAVNE